MWQRWLLGLSRAEVPENVRFLVLDRTEAPALDELCDTEPALVMSQALDLDMPAAYEELAKTGDPSEPGVMFRTHFVALTNAVGRGDLQVAEREGRAAVTIAKEQGWLAQEFVIYMTLGAGFLGQGRGDSAYAAYGKAEQLAHAAKEHQEPAADKLIVQARMAQATVLVNDGRFPEAAVVYQDTAPLASEQEDHLLAMENWRMASYCHASAKQAEQAWTAGWHALKAGEALDDQTRANCTLPYVGQGLLGLTQGPPYEGMEHHVHERMTQLVGPDWQQKLEQRAPK
jgi:hypothetical protein